MSETDWKERAQAAEAECRRRALIIGETVRMRKSAQKRAVKIACIIAGERIKDALDGTRAVLGAAPVTGDPDGESTVDAAKRVVAERDALRAEIARLTALLRDRDAAAVAVLADVDEGARVYRLAMAGTVGRDAVARALNSLMVSARRLAGTPL